MPRAVVPLSIVTLPVVPRVDSVIFPLMTLSLPKSIALLFTSVVKLEVVVTVITPLSVIASPEVTDRAPVTPTVPRFTAVVVLSNVKLLVPVVLTPIAPVNAAEPSVI